MMKNLSLPTSIVCTIIALVFSPLCMSSSNAAPKPLPEIMVSLGDSITDGYTYQILLAQALSEAGQKAPRIVNAGVASDTAAMMLARLDRDVFPYKPGLVTIMAGSNDVGRGVTTADYEATVESIVSKLDAAGIKVILLTPPIMGPKHAERNAGLESYIEALERIAKKHNYSIARVHESMRAAAAEKPVNLLSADDIHLSYAGYRVMTRAILDAMSYPDVAVPEKMNVPLLPGIVKSWLVRISPDNKPLDDAATATLAPDDTWKTLALPQGVYNSGADNDWWQDQERQRGYGNPKPVLGPAKLVQGVATIDSPKEHSVFINTGAQLQSVWLNGERLYKNAGWTGWHAGKERIPAKLKQGRNTLVIETNDIFFLGVTENNDW